MKNRYSIIKKILPLCIVLFLITFNLFTQTSSNCGDVNTDGIVNIVDALIIAKYYVGLSTLTIEESIADVNGDGTVNILDSLLIARFYIGLESTLNCAVVPKPVKEPNIVFILSDDGGYADWGFHGSNVMKTPNLDKLAKNGVIFTDAHMTASNCSPSRAGIISGRYQQRFGHEYNMPPKGKGMPPSVKTIAEAMKEQGYATAAFGKWHLGETDSHHPNNQGFDEFYGHRDGGNTYRPSSGGLDHNGKSAGFNKYLTLFLADRTSEYIEKNKDKKFFIYLAPNAVHTPMEAMKEHLALFSNSNRKTLAAMTWALDLMVGQVVETLKKNNLLENTLIIFTNDNGGPPANNSSNAPLRGRKKEQWEGGQRVPFIIHWPSEVPGNQVFDGLVSSLDIYATCVANSGGIPAANLDGVDLIPFITGKKSGSPHDILFWRRGRFGKAMRQGKWKLISPKNSGFQLYNLENDLQEKNNVAAKNPDIVNDMKKILSAWESELAKPMWIRGQK